VPAVAGALLLSAYAWWVVSLPPFSGRATVGVLLGGCAAVLLGSRQRAPTHRPATAGEWATARWAVLAAVAGAWQLAAYLQHPRADHPTLSSLTNALLDWQPRRAAAFVLWVLVARELARR
jgi:hypothetical protein